MAADFKNASAALTIRGGMAESRVKETCVMHAKFTNHCQIRGHFCRIFWWYRHSLLAYQNVECARIQDDLLSICANFFPIISRIISANFAKVDHAGMRFGMITNQAVATGAEVNRKTESVLDHSIARDQWCLSVQICECHIV